MLRVHPSSSIIFVTGIIAQLGSLCVIPRATLVFVWFVIFARVTFPLVLTAFAVSASAEVEALDSSMEVPTGPTVARFVSMFAADIFIRHTGLAIGQVAVQSFGPASILGTSSQFVFEPSNETHNKGAAENSRPACPLNRHWFIHRFLSAQRLPPAAVSELPRYAYSASSIAFTSALMSVKLSLSGSGT